MKALYQLVLISCLIASNLFSQGKSDNDIEEISQEEWNDIVDYVNAEVTVMYMLEYRFQRNKIKEKERIGLDDMYFELTNNSIENPISFDMLNSTISEGWGNTLTNLSSPIDSLKSLSPRKLESLFDNVASILVYRKSNVFQNSRFDDLRSLLNKSFISKNDVPVKNNEELKNANRPSVTTTSIENKKSFWDLWMIPTLLFLITSIILFVKWRKTIKKHNGLVKQHEHESEISKNTINGLNHELNDLKRKNATIKAKPTQRSYDNTYRKPEQQKNIVIDEPKAPEIELIPIEKPKVQKILYAGKPTTDSKFSPVSSSPLSGQTIYKLYVHEDGLSADFEIELVDQFITREVTNAPDEYLYRVCNQENSNKEFSREIVTTKKGLTSFINGDWIVKEENKAIIKFQ